MDRYKIGGTSVATRDNWCNITRIVTNHLDNNLRPIIVCSAPDKVSDLLQLLLQRALHDEYLNVFATIKKIYQDLAQAMNVNFVDCLQQHFERLARFIQGISLLGEVSARTQAQVMSFGEIMLTLLGASYLSSQGIHNQLPRPLAAG